MEFSVITLKNSEQQSLLFSRNDGNFYFIHSFSNNHWLYIAFITYKQEESTNVSSEKLFRKSIQKTIKANTVATVKLTENSEDYYLIIESQTLKLYRNSELKKELLSSETKPFQDIFISGSETLKTTAFEDNESKIKVFIEIKGNQAFYRRENETIWIDQICFLVTDEEQVPLVVFTDNDIKIVNGQIINSDLLKELFDYFGLSFVFDNENNKAYLKTNNESLVRLELLESLENFPVQVLTWNNTMSQMKVTVIPSQIELSKNPVRLKVYCQVSTKEKNDNQMVIFNNLEENTKKKRLNFKIEGTEEFALVLKKMENSFLTWN